MFLTELFRPIRSAKNTHRVDTGDISRGSEDKPRFMYLLSLITLIDWYWETSEATRPTVNPSNARPVKRASRYKSISFDNLLKSPMTRKLRVAILSGKEGE